MSVQSAYRPATRRDVEVITPQAMTNWFSPLEMLRTGVKALLGTLFGAYLDRREVEAAMQAGVIPQPYHDYSARQDGMWIDYVADTGDGWNSTYTVASLLGGATL